MEVELSADPGGILTKFVPPTEMLFAGILEQFFCAGDFWYQPVGQSSHRDVAFFPKRPRVHGICVAAPEFSKPGTIALQEVAPISSWYWPGTWQSLQADDAFRPLFSECLPGAHSLHSSDRSNPAVLEYVPAGQSVHAKASDIRSEALTPLLPCFPAGHSAHAVASALLVESYPVAYLPCVHSVHASFRYTLDQPLGHDAHTLLSPRKYFPSPHASQIVLPMLVVIMRPVAHASHGVVRFCSVEAVFFSHGVQAGCPVLF